MQTAWLWCNIFKDCFCECAKASSDQKFQTLWIDAKPLELEREGAVAYGSMHVG